MIGAHHFQYNGIGTTTITAEHSRLMQANGLHKLRVNMIDHVVVKCGHMSGRNEQQRKPEFNAFNMSPWVRCRDRRPAGAQSLTMHKSHLPTFEYQGHENEQKKLKKSTDLP